MKIDKSIIQYPILILAGYWSEATIMFAVRALTRLIQVDATNDDI